MVIENLKIYKSSGIGQFPAELIHSGGRIVCSEIRKLINCVWSKEEIPQQWKEPLYLFKRRVITQIAVINVLLLTPST
jgi:hypothetical protein